MGLFTGRAARAEGTYIIVGQCDVVVNFHESPPVLTGNAKPGELGVVIKHFVAKFAAKGGDLPSVLRDLAEQVEDYMDRMSAAPKGDA